MKCRSCKKKHEAFNSLDNWCKNIDCQTSKAMFLLEKKKKQDEKQRKSEKRNKRTIHSHLFIKENKADLQNTINHIARLIDKGVRCIDCDRTEANPCWDGGHRESRGSNPSLRYNLHNIFKQTRYCNSKSEGNKVEYNEGLMKMYGNEYYKKVDALKLTYPTINILHNEIPEHLKEARKILRELKKLDLEYSPDQRIKLREEYNKRIGIYK